MTEVATADKSEKEADHHPYFRPKDAATLILIDRSGDKPKVLVGKRHDKVVFMPGKFVFPGGRVDKSDNRVPVAAPIPKELEANLLKGSPKITAVARARAGGRRDPRGLRGNRPLPRPQGRTARSDARRPVEAVRGGRPAARSVRPVPDRARDHPARPRPALRYPVLHRGCIEHRPPRRGRDPCRRRTGGAGLGRDRLEAAGRSASHDQECARRTRKAPRHRPAAATTRRCRSSISTAARCRRMCWGREGRSLPVIARSAATKQSILATRMMDCFAALAMTLKSSIRPDPNRKILLAPA